jgi:hypothetical protein
MALGTAMPSQCSSFRVARVAICRNFNYQAVRGELHYLKNHRPFFPYNGTRATPVLAAENGSRYRKEISSDLQLFGPTLRLGCRHRNWFLGRSIGDGLNHPLPAGMAGFHVHGESSAAAFVDLHSPVVAVGRNREHVCECGREHHAGEHANQIGAHRFFIPHNPLHYCSFPWCVWWIAQSH